MSPKAKKSAAEEYRSLAGFGATAAQEQLATVAAMNPMAPQPRPGPANRCIQFDAVDLAAATALQDMIRAATGQFPSLSRAVKVALQLAAGNTLAQIRAAEADVAAKDARHRKK